jgi:hypothetical protein
VDGPFAFFLLILALFGVAGGLQGRAKGSSFLLWFCISACVPLFGFVASVVYPGPRSELRRQCDGCGRLLPITDTMCMGCGTDLAFPEVRYLPADVNPPAPRAADAEGDGADDDADDEDDEGVDDGDGRDGAPPAGTAAHRPAVPTAE